MPNHWELRTFGGNCRSKKSHKTAQKCSSQKVSVNQGLNFTFFTTVALTDPEQLLFLAGHATDMRFVSVNQGLNFRTGSEVSPGQSRAHVIFRSLKAKTPTLFDFLCTFNTCANPSTLNFPQNLKKPLFAPISAPPADPVGGPFWPF